jgi:hypothetical protein
VVAVFQIPDNALPVFDGVDVVALELRLDAEGPATRRYQATS